MAILETCNTLHTEESSSKIYQRFENQVWKRDQGTPRHKGKADEIRTGYNQYNDFIFSFSGYNNILS